MGKKGLVFIMFSLISSVLFAQHGGVETFKNISYFKKDVYISDTIHITDGTDTALVCIKQDTLHIACATCGYIKFAPTSSNISGGPTTVDSTNTVSSAAGVLTSVYYFGDTVVYFKNGYRVAVRVPKLVVFSSVLAAQNYAAADSLNPGGNYLIPDMGGFTGFIILQATTDSTLAISGQGKFKSGVMSNAVDAIIYYNLTANSVRRVIASPDGLLTPNDITDLGDGVLSVVPLDDATIYGNILINPIISNFSVGSFAYNFMDNVGLNVENSSNVQSNYVEYGAILSVGSVSACAYSSNKQGPYSTVTLTDNQTLASCIVGSSKTLDLSAIAAGYSQTGKYYTAEGSNFEMDATFYAGVNTITAGLYDITAFNFVGFVYINAPTDTLEQLVGYASDNHAVRFVMTGLDLLVKTNAFIFCPRFPAIDQTANVATYNEGDYFTLQNYDAIGMLMIDSKQY